MTTQLLDQPLEERVDAEIVHIWCEWCDTRPQRAICGADLRGEEQVDYGGPVCPRCSEFWQTHVKVLHPDPAA